MIAFPPCKINIGLNIISKRADGYHNIESVFYPIPLCDLLEINMASNFNFTSSGYEIMGPSENNLVVRAYELLKDDFNISPVHIHLHKMIPMGAGLGGGSSDAAYTLTLLNQLFNLKIDKNGLEAYALKLGSDCPFFIENKAKFIAGRGESMEDSPINLKGYYLYIINPGIHVSTAEAYAEIVINENPKHLTLNARIENWKNTVFNQFETPILKKHPSIGKIKAALYKKGAIYASMSGTGSTVYGIFEAKPKTFDLYDYEKVLEL